MKFMDIIIDSFWVAMMLWLILYGWVYFDLPTPIAIKDTLYTLTDVMDPWMELNAVLGTIRFIRDLCNKDKRRGNL